MSPRAIVFVVAVIVAGAASFFVWSKARAPRQEVTIQWRGEPIFINKQTGVAHVAKPKSPAAP